MQDAIRLISIHQNHYDPKQTYRDPNRTYHDVVQALAQCPSFSPRTDVYSKYQPDYISGIQQQ